MKQLLVVGILWNCPGGPLGRLLPAAAKVHLCAPQLVLEAYDPARARQARRRVAELGEPAQLYACRAVRCSAPLVSWNTTPTFKEPQ